MPLKSHCMFCGKDDSAGELTAEHFVPKCLWEGKRPEFTITGTSHKSCNAAFSDDDEYFRDVLNMSNANYEHPEQAKIRNGPLGRKFRGKHGVGMAKRFKIKETNVTTPGGIFLENELIMEVDLTRVNRVIEKVARGCFQHLRGDPVPQDYSVEVVRPEHHSLMSGVVDKMGAINSFGDDVFMCRHAQEESMPNVMAFSFVFYRSFEFVTYVIPKSALKRFRDAPTGPK